MGAVCEKAGGQNRRNRPSCRFVTARHAARTTQFFEKSLMLEIEPDVVVLDESAGYMLLQLSRQLRHPDNRTQLLERLRKIVDYDAECIFALVQNQDDWCSLACCGFYAEQGCEIKYRYDAAA